MPKTGRNDPCPCGSGKKYKACCGKIAPEERLPFSAILHDVHKASEVGFCMHPEASRETCGKIIRAHTIQRSRVLNALCDSNNKLLTFQLKGDKVFSVKEVGWRNASTFKAFCEVHDGPTFDELEQQPFTGSPSQRFLTAYRALCWETFQKVRSRKGAPTLRSKMLQGAQAWSRTFMNHALTTHHTGSEKGLEELLRIKKQMDQDLIHQDYSRYASTEFILKGTPFLAATGAIWPNYSISGKPLQKLGMSATLECLSFGIDVSSQGTHFTFAWNAAENSPRDYMSEVLALPHAELASFLCQFCFMHCENTFFSKSWWNSLSSQGQKFFTSLMSNTNPYAAPPRYDLSLSLPEWTLQSVKSLP